MLNPIYFLILDRRKLNITQIEGTSQSRRRGRARGVHPDWVQVPDERQAVVLDWSCGREIDHYPTSKRLRDRALAGDDTTSTTASVFAPGSSFWSSRRTHPQLAGDHPGGRRLDVDEVASSTWSAIRTLVALQHPCGCAARREAARGPLAPAPSSKRSSWMSITSSRWNRDGI
jgi:hypothetical protein